MDIGASMLARRVRQPGNEITTLGYAIGVPLATAIIIAAIILWGCV